MIVSVLTCDRAPSYIEGTLASLRATAPDAEPRLFRDEWARDTPATQRLTLSFRRALLEASGDAFIIEDDVEFRYGWRARLDAAIGRSKGRYFLACYSPHRFVGDVVARCNPWLFFGTQAQFIPASVRLDLAEYLDRHQEDATLDGLIGRWCFRKQVPLLATVPSLVQHVGRVSSLGDPFHESPM